MSWKTRICPKCGSAEDFVGAGPFPGGSVFAVSWRCPECLEVELEVCAIGPEIPKDGMCLNCGAKTDSDQCDSCGVSGAELEQRVAAAIRSGSVSEQAAGIARKGLIGLALNALDIHLREQTNDHFAWFEKGRILQNIGLWSESIAPLEQALDCGAPRETRIAIGCALSELGRHQDAVDAYQRLIDDPRAGKWLPVAYSNQGNSYSDLEQLDRSIELHKRAIALDPKQSVFRSNLVTVLRKRKDFLQALAVLDDAMREISDDDRDSFVYQRAYTLCELERGEEAIRDIDDVLSRDERNPAKLYVRGWALGLVGKLDEARKALETVLEVSPGHPEASRAIAMIDNALSKQKRSWWKFW